MTKKTNLSLLALAGVAGAGGLAMIFGGGRKRGGQYDDGPRPASRRANEKGLDLSAKTVTIRTPSKQELYDYWRDFTHLPEVMENVERVDILPDGRSRWYVLAPGGTIELVCAVTEDRPGERIAWKSEPGSDVETEGHVAFEPAPGERGTRVALEIAYRPPGGTAGKAVAKLLQREPAIQARRDLRRFKMLMETGEIATSHRVREGG